MYFEIVLRNVTNFLNKMASWLKKTLSHNFERVLKLLAYPKTNVESNS
jgi:hypothetical protein